MNDVRYPGLGFEITLEFLLQEISDFFPDWKFNNYDGITSAFEEIKKTTTINSYEIALIEVFLIEVKEKFKGAIDCEIKGPVIGVTENMLFRLNKLQADIKNGKYADWEEDWEEDSTKARNPANDPQKSETLVVAKKQLLDLVSEVALRNDNDKELRDELVAFLKALLAFLGEGIGGAPKKVPRSIPSEAKRIAETLKHSNDASESAIALYGKIIEIISKIFS